MLYVGHKLGTYYFIGMPMRKEIDVLISNEKEVPYLRLSDHAGTALEIQLDHETLKVLSEVIKDAKKKERSKK